MAMYIYIYILFLFCFVSALTSVHPNAGLISLGNHPASLKYMFGVSCSDSSALDLHIWLGSVLGGELIGLYLLGGRIPVFDYTASYHI